MTQRKPSFAGNALWAVLDYGLFALAGMIASILLARGLSPHDFGAYSVSFAVYTGVFLLHGALFAEPMLVLLSHRYREQPGSYLRALLAAHAVYSVAVVIVVSLLALAADEPLRAALFWMALAAPFMNLAQLLRRICYARWSPRSAAAGAGLYVVLLSAAVLALEHGQRLGLGSAYAAFAGCSLIVSSAWLVRAFREPAGEGVAHLSLAEVARAHFAFARYGVGTALLGWVPLNLWYVALPWLGTDSLSASGHLRALVSLMQPMLQVNGALATALYPTFTRRLANDKHASPWRFSGGMMLLSAPYAPLLVLLGPLANELLYRGIYPGDALTLWSLGAVPAFFALSSSLRAFSVAREQPHLPLWAASASALTCLSAGIALCAWNPLAGSALAMLLGFAVQALALAWLIQRRSADLAFSSPSRAA